MSDEPEYEAEDCGCACTEDGVCSEWSWNAEQRIYICEGCGEVQ